VSQTRKTLVDPTQVNAYVHRHKEEPGRRCTRNLHRRSFGLDVLACPRCGGRLRLIALIEEASVIERILRHLGLPTEIPAAHQARAPPRSIERGSRCPRREIEFDPRG